MNNFQRFLNDTPCVTLPTTRNLECNYLKRDNYLSEYYTSEDKLKVLNSLGILDYMSNILNIVNKNLSLYVPLEYLENNFVKKKDVYYLLDANDLNGLDSGTVSEETNNETNNNETPSITKIIVDDELSFISTNPVQNKIISEALLKKADKDILELYVKTTTLIEYLRPYQTKLTAGRGINIDESNVISTTLDLNPFVVVTLLPEGNDINPNKIYLVKRSSYYIQYKYINGEWTEIGRDYLEINIDLSLYYTKAQSDARYLLKDDYSGVESIIETYVTRVLKNYVKKSDVYNPYYDDSDDSGSGSSSGGGPNYAPALSIVVDSTLSAFSENPVENRAIYNELLNKVNVSDLTNYVTKTELTTTLLNYNSSSLFKTINNLTIVGTGNIQIELVADNELSPVSTNAIQNKIVTVALSNKVETSLFLTEIIKKQNKLTAGYGINLSGDIISVAIDVNPFVITDNLPLIGNTDKIYLKKNGSQYDLYIYSDNWELTGTIDFSVDLIDYIKSADVYENFVTKENLITLLNEYLSNDALTDYITTEESNYNLTTQVNLLRNWIEELFVKKSDVYTGGENNINPDSGGTITPGDLTSSIYYESDIPDGTLTNVTVGNILQGTNIATLKGLTFSLILDMMLFKEIWPVSSYEHNINLGILPRVVKVGDPIVLPTILAVWNQNILPVSEINYTLVLSIEGDNYTTVGRQTFTLNYSYPSGTYIITSNYGNTREVEKPAKQASITRTVDITYPWYLNDVEQSVLVPINTDYTLQVSLIGSPTIAIPGEFSTCLIQANLGLGFMDATWTRSTILKNGITYSLWTKEDAYILNVEHKITFNINL